MMKIGIYGGTFDPIHFGHIGLAVNVMEKHQLDQVWFCPARYSPHKIGKECTSVEHRYRMCELALEGINEFKVVDFEIKRDGPSYTIDTLRDLKVKFPNDQFYLIIGNDSVKGFFEWKEPEEIVSLAKVLVGTRVTIKEIPLPPGANPVVFEAILEGMTETPIMEISSTEIRERVRQGKYLGYLLNQKVIDYIYLHHLYLS